MKRQLFISFFLFVAIAAAQAQAQMEVPAQVGRIEVDSLRETSRANRFYDSLASRSQNRALTRLLYNNLFRSVDSTLKTGGVVDEQRLYEPFRGKRIASITIVREGAFSDNPSRMARLADNLHFLTREWVIRNYLLFRAGGYIDPALMVKNKQLLQSTGFIFRTDIDIAPDADSTQVNVTVVTRDKWTLGLDLNLDIGSRSMLEVYESDFVGSGHRLSVAMNFSDSPFQWGGVMAGYTMPNLLGKFVRGEVQAGRNFDAQMARVALSKDLILPTDYAGGISYTTSRNPVYLICYDSTMIVGLNTIDTWAGGSLYSGALRSSAFATMHLYNDGYGPRPQVTPRVNPRYDNATRLLMGLGLYRERFLTTTLIYGYGNVEYLPVGYKAEVVGGYNWEEFGHNYYLGSSLTGGAFFSNDSYIAGRVAVGSFLAESGPSGLHNRWNRSLARAELKYFTPLLVAGRSNIRNLSTISYTVGWNRMSGCDEMVGFTTADGLLGFSRYVTGRSRLILDNETVVFTPLAPWGFRIAVFGYSNYGLIGDRWDVFANDFFGTVGVGMRVLNDRLVFPALQIRLGFFFGKPGWVGGNFFSLGSQQSLRPYSFTPTPASIEPYW